MKKLVVFYSRAGENYFNGVIEYLKIGNTEKVAKAISKFTNADLFKLEQKFPYDSDYNICIKEAKKDLQANARPQLISLPKNFENYDEIYLGYPNYWGTMPMAVYTFLETFDFRGKIIHPFCTHEGSGLSSTEKEISQSAKGSKVSSGLAILGNSVDKATDIIERWVKNEL